MKNSFENVFILVFEKVKVYVFDLEYCFDWDMLFLEMVD